MRAIRPHFSFIALAALLGCSPNLSRSAGSLDIQALGTRGGDRLEVVVISGDARYTQASDLAIGGGRVTVESVPEGAVGVTVSLFLGQTPIATREGGGVVRAGAATLVVVDFGAGSVDGGVADGGPTSVESGAIPAFVRGLRGSAIQNERLAGTGQLDHDLFEQFRDAAAVALETRSFDLSVAHVDLELLTGVSRNVDRLDRLFHDRVDVTVVDRRGTHARAAVGQGDIPSSTRASFSGSGMTLGSLQPGIDEADLDVELAGESDQSAGADFSAEVAVRLTFRAFRR